MPFPHEYAVAGWFRWVQPTDVKPVHVVFRLALNDEDTNRDNQRLGDRDLAVFVKPSTDNGVLTFSTYSYTDLAGNGQADISQNTPYRNQLTEWHFIYFGYTFDERRAFGFVEFND